MRAYKSKNVQCCAVTSRSRTQLEEQVKEEHFVGVIEEETQNLKYNVMKKGALINKLDTGKVQDDKLPTKN